MFFVRCFNRILKISFIYINIFMCILSRSFFFSVIAVENELVKINLLRKFVFLCFYMNRFGKPMDKGGDPLVEKCLEGGTRLKKLFGGSTIFSARRYRLRKFLATPLQRKIREKTYSGISRLNRGFILCSNN